MTILVTGAGGVLGRMVVEALQARGVPARGMGRGEAPAGHAAAWRRADLLSGEGLAGALNGVAAVIHCASDPRKPDDDVRVLVTLIDVTRRREGVHIVYVGIAGIEAVARILPYYQVKLACERRLAESGLPHTVCRATQFHPFVDYILDWLGRGPVQLCPSLRLQPVDPRFVADRLVDHALAGPRGRTADVHGPELLDMAALVTPWLRARGHHRLRVPIPAFGILSAFGRLRQVAGVAGGATWREWLDRSLG